MEVVPAKSVASSPATICDLDLNTCEVKDTEFESDFELVAEKDCEVTAIAGYFDTFFELPEKKVRANLNYLST